MTIQTPVPTIGVDTNQSGSSYEPARVMIYSHDTYGLGHLRRCLKISEGLKRVYPELSILLLTGSPHAGRYPLPEGMDFIKLPSVVKTGEASYLPRSLKSSFDTVLELRQNIILEAAKAFEPTMMLVDHSPLGMKGELKKTLFWLKERNPQCQLGTFFPRINGQI